MPQNNANFFYLAQINVCTLPCETWNAHCAGATVWLWPRCKNIFTPCFDLSHFNCGLQLVRIKSTWLERVENTARERIQNTTDLDELKQQLKTGWTQPDHTYLWNTHKTLTPFIDNVYYQTFLHSIISQTVQCILDLDVIGSTMTNNHRRRCHVIKLHHLPFTVIEQQWYGHAKM